MSDRIKIEEYNEKIKRTNIIQWSITGAYIVLVTLLGFLPLVYPVDELGFVVGYNVLVLGGMVIIIAVLVYPFFRKVKMPEAEDGGLVDDLIGTGDLPLVYHERIRIFLLFEIVVPMTVFLVGIGAWTFIWGERLSGIITIVCGVACLILLPLFGTLEVTANNEYFHFHYSLFGKKVPYQEIKSIRSVPVHAFRDYKGWGLRGGPDGSYGYIARGKVGVRVELKNERTYVITVPDPDILVRYVRTKRKAQK